MDEEHGAKEVAPEPSGEQPDRQATPDTVAGMLEDDIPVEPERRAGHDEESLAEASASGLRQPDPGGEFPAVKEEEESLGARRAREAIGATTNSEDPARQAGGEEDFSSGQAAREPTADDDERELQGWSQPESSAQKYS